MKKKNLYLLIGILSGAFFAIASFAGFMTYDRYKKTQAAEQEAHDQAIMQGQKEHTLEEMNARVIESSVEQAATQTEDESVSAIDTTSEPIIGNETMLGDDGEYHGRSHLNE